MTAFCRVLFLALCLAPNVQAAVNLYQPIAELDLKDGRKLESVTIVSYGSTTVMAKWSGGRGTIAYEILPDDVRDEALKHKPKPAAAAAPTPPTAPGAKPSPKPTSAPDAAELLEKAKSEAAAEGTLWDDLYLADHSLNSDMASMKITVRNLSSSYRDFSWSKLQGVTSDGTLVDPSDCRPADGESGLTISPESTRVFNVGFGPWTDSSYLKKVVWKL